MYKIVNSKIDFDGDNCLVFLDTNTMPCIVNLVLFHNSFFYCGKKCYFGDTVKVECSEQRNVIIGNECMFSQEVCIKTSDSHILYDVHSHSRINPSKSIFIGDRVWIGQTVKILKGSRIGSGSTIGA